MTSQPRHTAVVITEQSNRYPPSAPKTWQILEAALVGGLSHYFLFKPLIFVSA